MKKLYFLSVLIFTSFFSFSQEIYPKKYWIQFTDKNNNEYKLSEPENFLSERALKRRENQKIGISQNDLPVNKSYIDKVKNLGVKVLYSSRWLNGVVVECSDTNLLKSVYKLSFVKKNKSKKSGEKAIYIKEKYSAKACELYSISENKNKKIKNNVFDYGEALNQIEMLKGNLLHNLGFTGEGVQIAVIDGGFFKADSLSCFDILRNENRLVGTRDFVKGGEVSFKSSSHGTKVLSTISGNISGELIGTAPKASIWLLRSEDTQSEYRIEEYNWLAAAEFADSVGVDVINSSLGYSEFDDESMNYTYENMDGNTSIVSQAADFAASKGILVVCSAGNEGSDPWHYISSPADADSVLSVGAVNSDGTHAYFSSYGPSADNRIKPDVVAQGSSASVQSVYGEIIPANGTSFSSPILAGMVACLWQAHPEMTNMQVIGAIKKSASYYQKPDTLYGYGLPDFNKAHQILNVIEKENLTNQKSNIVKISPNPFSNSISIHFAKAENSKIKIEICDLQGKKVFREKIKNNAFYYKEFSIKDLEKLSSGIYILRIFTKNNTFSQKIVKQ